MTEAALKAVTRGQPAALAGIAAMIRGGAARTVLLVGPAASGKTTLALDLAAGLLCRDLDPGARPCRSCRGCRLVESGNHPDLHRLAPDGPGGQVRIGAADGSEPGTVRNLIGELALLSVEGGARVAIVEQAHRLNDDAQNALLKLLEEPPTGVTIVLCADDEEALLPTVRSRCARIRLGTASTREIEAWLGEMGAADAPTAARLARLAGGRPGLALAYARSRNAARLRGELARGLIDMLGMHRADRLAAVRDLLKSAAALDAALAETRGSLAPAEPAGGTARGRGRRARGAAAGPAGAQHSATSGADMAVVDAAPVSPGIPGDSATPAESDNPDADSGAEGVAARTPASARRAAAATLIETWTAVARDLLVAGAGGGRSLREAELMDEIRAAAPHVDRAALLRFIDRVNWVAAQADANVSPELSLDVLALEWPHDTGAAAAEVARRTARHGPGPAKGPGQDAES